jgi:hypothetical protein
VSSELAKMSVVSLLGVNVMNNPAKFGDKYEFEITFECLEELQKGARNARLSCTNGFWMLTAC